MKIIYKLFRWIKNLVLFLFILSLFLVIVYKYVPICYTPYMLTNNFKQLTQKEKIRLDYKWKSLSEISDNLVKAVIASEDYLYLIHNGFDTDKSNLDLNKGARILYLDNRTISQQTARNTFLFPSDNIFNKIFETYFTILIEFVWGKKRIMEVYLNTITIDNIYYGAEAISEKYFKTPALELNTSEASLLSACLNGSQPSDLNNPTTYILRRQAKIMDIMKNTININW